MRIFELRKEILDKLKNRKSDNDSFISKEDIDNFEKTKMEIIKMPFCGLVFLLVSKQIFNYVKLPSLIRNPLSIEENSIFKKKLWNKYIVNNFIVLSLFGLIGMYSVKYEVTKFYMFLKYENLVYKYLESADKRQMEHLARKYENNFK